jgi:2-polyprenyl-6-methoxyphenol hydroxylase-like FAD-dependent oxidoreductase
MEAHYQVIIVGGGPVGVALTVELGQRGVSCALVERHPTPQRIPKGQNLTQRTLEHFYFWGCVDELRAARLLPPGYPIGGVTAYGDLMSEYWYAPAGRELVRSYYFQENDRLPQYLSEEVLRARLHELPSVTTLFGWSAKTIEQNEKSARVTVMQEGWPYEEQILEADYVVGCDGARSMVREQLGIDRGGADFDQRMVLAVFRSRELHEGLKRFPERTTYRVLRPELKGYWQFFGRVDVGEGWFFHAPVPPETTAQNFDFHGLLQQAAGFSFPCSFDHVGFWDLRVAVASRYRQGRAFIAGDAAHTHPPYGGFGLNSGLEDVANLGWKLAAALQGWGGDGLLDSYGEERRPIFVETGEAVIAGGIEADRAFLERYNPDRDRAEFERAWKELGTGGGSRVQSYEPHYEGSSVVLGPEGAVCSIHGKHSFVARPGHHLAPSPLTSGRDVFEELGSGFTLLAFDAHDGDVRAFQQAADSLNIPLHVVRDTLQDRRQAYEAKLILVRPDQYVVWSSDELRDDASALLRRVTGIA